MEKRSKHQTLRGRGKNKKLTSGDHLVLIGSPAKFTTAVEPCTQFLHSCSSAITMPGKSLAKEKNQEVDESDQRVNKIINTSFILIKIEAE